MADYISIIAEQLGISIWLLLIVAIWSGVWKLLALWKSARKNSPAWFIVLGIVNTLGILEILYLFVFSEMKGKKKSNKSRKKK